MIELSEQGKILKPKTQKQIMGKKSRAAGSAFERKVREHLTKQGWIINRWNNQLNEEYKIVPAKVNFRFGSRNNGFPDYLAIHPLENGIATIMLIECKMGKYLDREEKTKCEAYELQRIPVYIAYKGTKRGEILYKRWNE